MLTKIYEIKENTLKEKIIKKKIDGKTINIAEKACRLVEG